MSGDKHESDTFSNQHAPTMRIQMRLYFMKYDKSSDTIISSLVFAAICYTSTVAVNIFDIEKYVVPYYTNTYCYAKGKFYNN